MPARLSTHEEHVGFQSRSKGVFVQSNHGTLPRRRFNRQDIESEGSFSGAIFAEELPRDARKMTLFLVSDRFFGRAKLASRRRPGLHLDKRDRRAIVSHQVDFSLHSAIRKISRNHHVSVTPQIPIRIRFAANTRAPRPLLCCFSRRRRGRFRQAFSCGPVHQAKHCSSKNRHGVFPQGFLCGLCALCVESFVRSAKRLLTQRAQRTQRRKSYINS